jgi:hypothetical protein
MSLLMDVAVADGGDSSSSSSSSSSLSSCSSSSPCTLPYRNTHQFNCETYDTGLLDCYRYCLFAARMLLLFRMGSDKLSFLQLLHYGTVLYRHCSAV